MNQLKKTIKSCSQLTKWWRVNWKKKQKWIKKKGLKSQNTKTSIKNKRGVILKKQYKKTMIKKITIKFYVKIKCQEMKFKNKWIKYNTIKRIRIKNNKINKLPHCIEPLQGQHAFQDHEMRKKEKHIVGASPCRVGNGNTHHNMIKRVARHLERHLEMWFAVVGSTTCVNNFFLSKIILYFN